MRKKLIAANWKMHGTLSSVRELMQKIIFGIDETKKSEIKNSNIDIAIFPASIHIPLLSELLKNSNIMFGAQNFYCEPAGAFTGEIALPMIEEFGCQIVLVGHSERRQIFFEDNKLIAAKFCAAIKQNIKPILCVGETRIERETGETENIIRSQLASIVEAASINAFGSAVIAYEPVWAIGTGLTATPEQAQAVHSFIRTWIAEQDVNIAAKLQILYGGSVKAANAAALFAMPDIDGALVGGASLNAEEFLAICRAAE